MFKKNKDKIENNENSVECISTSPKPVKQLLVDAPKLFSSPDIVMDDDNLPNKTENEELDSKTNIVEQADNTTTMENSKMDVPINLEQGTANKDDSSPRVRKISNRSNDSPIENALDKTVKDILNDISSKIANQAEIIDEDNLIDELVDLNEDLNSV